MIQADYIERFLRGLSLVRERVPLILSEPRAHSRETMILALIAALVLVLTALSVMAVAGAVADARVRRRMRLRRRPSAVARRALLFVAVIIAASAAVSVIPMIPAAGVACGACHAVRTGVATWEADVHHSVACYGCHARPGALGAAEAGVRGVASLMGPEIRSTAQSGSCLGCHPAIREKTLVRSGIRVRHREIIDAGMDCLGCHRDVGHDASAAASEQGGPSAARAAVQVQGLAPRPVMSRCLRCHDGVMAPSDCQACHVDRNPSDTAAATTPRGDTPAPVSCDGCHMQETQDRCIRCHGLELPHPEQFPGLHAAASSAAPGVCARCHEGAVADPADACACHTDVNTHGTYSRWFPLHGPAATANGPGGCRCHEGAFCGFCHENDPFSRARL